ncbi:MAG: RNA polymerase factor sigma-54 [Deltaproteobacteria bacterium]|jgi:RNA polymerase sigma-54 factor|nr:RNA polymerase factor sigma-54 [Deltaproteobacteria bacterium]
MGFEIKQNMVISQNLRQEQKLIMTQQMQQAIYLLQLPLHELINEVNEQYMENPLLDKEEEKGGEEQDKSPKEETSEEDKETLQEVPSTDDMTVDEENKMRKDMEWESYVDDSSHAPVSRGSTFKIDNDDYTPFESRLESHPGLIEHLEWQLQVSAMTTLQKQIGTLIIGNLDPYGYLKKIDLLDIQQIATKHLKTEVPLEEVEKTHELIKVFDPVGVGSRDLAECLIVQARHLGLLDDILLQILQKHIPNLERKNYTKIARDLSITKEKVYESVKLIQTLEPKPGREFLFEKTAYITPDLYICKRGDNYVVELNDDGLPKLRISRYYNSLRKRKDSKEYVTKKMQKAKWLIQAIQMRQETITRTGYSLIKFQRDFFDKGAQYLRPLTLKDVAEDIDRHESTVSRVTNNKYVHTPQGVFELKYFFSPGIKLLDGGEIAAQSVKEKIREIVNEENPNHPWSDQSISEILRKEGIDVARRTVAKYRDQLNILSSSRRRNPF